VPRGAAGRLRDRHRPPGDGSGGEWPQAEAGSGQARTRANSAADAEDAENPASALETGGPLETGGAAERGTAESDTDAGAEPSGRQAADRTPTGAWRYTASPVDASVPRVRREIHELLLRQRLSADGGLLQDILLIVSELVTNAVQHAALLSPQIAVEVHIDAERVRIAVEDGHPFRPKPLTADHCQTSGRGLLLVQAITEEAGGACDVEHTASGGKAVWATLPLHPAPAGDAPATSRPPRR
jgi:hypothetical protein